VFTEQYGSISRPDDDRQILEILTELYDIPLHEIMRQLPEPSSDGSLYAASSRIHFVAARAAKSVSACSSAASDPRMLAYLCSRRAP